MKWIDQAGYAAAVGWSGKYSVTVAVGGIRFVAPIRTSDLVTITTKLVYTGTSSMPVSYTHLDVYKRQASDRLRRLNRGGGNPIFGRRRVTPAPSLSWACLLYTSRCV